MKKETQRGGLGVGDALEAVVAEGAHELVGVALLVDVGEAVAVEEDELVVDAVLVDVGDAVAVEEDELVGVAVLVGVGDAVAVHEDELVEDVVEDGDVVTVEEDDVVEVDVLVEDDVPLATENDDEGEGVWVLEPVGEEIVVPDGTGEKDPVPLALTVDDVIVDGDAVGLVEANGVEDVEDEGVAVVDGRGIHVQINPSFLSTFEHGSPEIRTFPPGHGLMSSLKTIEQVEFFAHKSLACGVITWATEADAHPSCSGAQFGEEKAGVPKVAYWM